jgi:hypothetical protein
MRLAERSRRRRQDPAERPLDRLLGRILAHGLLYRADAARDNIWHALCPCCRAPQWTLTIRERGRGGGIQLRCATGCSERQIHDALEREPVDARVEAAEAREAEAWALTAQMRQIAARALELALDTQREVARLTVELLRAAA